MSGLIRDLNENQRDTLAKLRSNLEDVLKPEHDDFFLRRFLVAQNFDLAKSEDLFRKDVEWRIKNKMDAVVRDFKPSEVCEKYWVGGVLDGYDKDDYPIWIIPVGTCDPKGLLHSCKSTDLIKNMIVILERTCRENKARCKQLGKEMDWGATLIMDLEDLGLQHLWKSFVDIVTEFLATTEKHYPETAKKVFVINSPALFPLAYSLISPFLPAYTREKVQILGGNWKEVLLQYIDADILPVHWGGTKTDPDGDPKCPSMIKPGGEVPESYYKKDIQLDEKDLTTREIYPGVKHEVVRKMTGDSGLLRYEFKSHEYDIAFGVQHIDEAGNSTIVLESKRYNSHLFPEDGELLLDKAGKYVLTFDNEYSWTRSKTISYWVEMLELSSDDNNAEKELSS